MLSFDLNDPTRATFDDRTAVRLDVAVVTGDTPLIDATYYELLGHLPNGSELDYWNPRFGSGSADVPALRHAIIADPSAGAAVRMAINALYIAFGGRDASSSELAFWGGRLADGEHYGGVRTAILDDPLGKGHTGAARGMTYREYFGRDPNANEMAVWDGFLHRGYDFGTVAATLAIDHGSVRRFTGTLQSDVFDFGPRVGHAVIYDFDRRTDLIKLSGTDFADIDPLDDAHARDVYEVNGSGHRVLVTLGEHDTILIRDVFLSLLRDGVDHFI